MYARSEIAACAGVGVAEGLSMRTLLIANSPSTAAKYIACTHYSPATSLSVKQSRPLCAAHCSTNSLHR